MRLEKRKKRGGEDTDRQRALRACRKHLDDLRRAHKAPPADVRIGRAGAPQHFEPAAPSSYHSSPAQLCSELGE